MKKTTEAFLAGCAKLLQKAAKKDLHEWPPTSVPIFYQPVRPIKKIQGTEQDEQ